MGITTRARECEYGSVGRFGCIGETSEEMDCFVKVR